MPLSLRKWAPALFGLILISPLFALPRPVNVSSIPWRVELLFSLFLLVALVAGFRSKKFAIAIENALKETSIRTLAAIMLVFSVWSGVSAIWSISPASALHHALVWANYTFILIGAYVVSGMLRGKGSIVAATAAPVLMVGVLCAFDFLTLQDFSVQEGTLRIRYGKFAEMLATNAPLLLAAALLARKRERLVQSLAVASIAWIGVMLSLSKGAFLAAVAGFAVLFILIAIFRRELLKKVVVAASLFLFLTVVFQLSVSSFTGVPSTANYISGSADPTRSTSDMRVYTWKVAAEMIRTNLLFGVGADNFGLTFNSSRSSLAQANPGDPDSAIGEDYVFERAHNEPLQIFSELGAVGFAIFAAFAFAAVGFVCQAIYRTRGRLSPLFYGGVAGMTAFAASSMVSSFSFRAYQNGIFFFVILGLTLSAIPKRKRILQKGSSDLRKALRPLALAAATTLLLFSGIKAASYYLVYFGERAPEVHTAIERCELASTLDTDNPGAELAAAERLVREERWIEAIPNFRAAIDRGFGVSVVYSYLANAQEKSGDLGGAEATLEEAVAIFPRSTFLRARLAVVMEKIGKHREAQEQLFAARSHDERQTNGWYAVIKDGILNAHLKATADPDHFAAPPDLMPGNAIYAYNDEKVRVD